MYSDLTCWPVANRLAPLLVHVRRVRGMNFQENPSDVSPDTAEKHNATQLNYPNYRSIGTKLGNFVPHARSVANYEYSA